MMLLGPSNVVLTQLVQSLRKSKELKMRPVQRSAIALTTLLLSAASLTTITAPAAVSATHQANSSKADASSQTTTAERDAAISNCATTWKLGAPVGP